LDAAMSDVLVLAYHSVSETWNWRFSVTPEQLERHMRHVLARGYRPVRFAEAVAPGAGKVVAVTFDDAFDSVFDRAFPVLARLGVPGTVFVVTDFAGTARPLAFGALAEYIGTPDEDELRAATWEQLAELRDAGWEIGSHTRTHRALPDLSDEELDRELQGSAADLEGRLGRPCTTLAYPFGATDERVRAAVRRASYAAAADFPPRFERATAYGWPRVGIYRDDDDRGFALKVSPAVRRLRSNPGAGAALRLLRAVR
jgi:peptidoglycan/xylan/chitin deacetylase (PgdA/CDA1 family)